MPKGLDRRAGLFIDGADPAVAAGCGCDGLAGSEAVAGRVAGPKRAGQGGPLQGNRHVQNYYSAVKPL